MSSAEPINCHFSHKIPFKTNQDVIKSSWKSTLWCHKQVRIFIDPEGKLAIQTIAQNAFARLASTILKFLSCGKIKSFGKKVISFAPTRYALPSDLAAPLSPSKQNLLFDIQCQRLTQFFLPSYKSLNDMGSQLYDYALSRCTDQEVNAKVMDLHLEILNFEQILNEEVQKDTTPEDLHNKFQNFEAEAKIMCQEYPAILEKFIDEHLQKKAQILTQQEEEPPPLTIPMEPQEETELEEETPTPVEVILPAIQEKEEEVKINVPPVPKPDQTLVQTEKSGTISEDISIPPFPQTIPPFVKKYIDSLSSARQHVIDLRNRYQFISADILAKKIEKIETKDIPALSLIKGQEEQLKAAIESLEDALDACEENIPYITQLLSLPKHSPHQQKLKEVVIADIRQSVEQFNQTMDQKKECLKELLKGNNDQTWYLKLSWLVETAKSKITPLANSHDSMESWIPGWHFIKSLVSSKTFCVLLETLDRKGLAKHLALTEQACKSTLDFFEDETRLEKILSLRHEYGQIKSLAALRYSQFEKDGQFLFMAIVEKVRNKLDKVIQKASSSLTDRSAMHEYADTLEMGVETLNGQLNEIEQHQEIDPIQQLIALKPLSSTHYATLHSRLVNRGKMLLEAYKKSFLEHNLQMISAVIPHLTDKKDEMIAIETKIRTKISEATALSTHYTARLHFWHIFNSQIPLSELSIDMLENYLKKVSTLIESGIKDITEDAENAGFILGYK